MTADIKPRRAFRLTLMIEADTLGDLGDQLYEVGSQAIRGELSTGVFGSPHAGGAYELLTNPGQTHDAYHAQLRAHLDHLKATRP